MAVLSKHGHELYRYKGLCFQLSARSDRHILRNNGHGWKLWKKIKPDVDLEEHTRQALARHQAADEREPAFVAFRELFHSLVNMKARLIVLEAVRTFSHDPDGLFVELDESHLRYSDYNPKLSHEDCRQLCLAYNAWEVENKQQNKTH